MTTPKRILVAGIGNIFLGDDGFGGEVVRRLLSGRQLPEGVKAVDFGIRGLHMAYDLLDGYDVVILVDTIKGESADEPGTITVLEADPTSEGGGIPDAHDMDPQNVFDLLADLGGHVDRLLVVGAKPADLSERIGLSEPLELAVGEAVRAVQELIEEETAYAGKES